LITAEKTENATTKYFKRVGIALTVLLNVILGGRSNQTFSARNWEWKMGGRPNIVWFIDFIFLKLFNEENHCKNSWDYWAYVLGRLGEHNV
jgi:hypothetical protein